RIRPPEVGAKRQRNTCYDENANLQDPANARGPDALLRPAAVLADEDRLHGGDDAEARKTRAVGGGDHRRMLDAKSFLAGYAAALDRIEHTAHRAVANRVHVDLKTLC